MNRAELFEAVSYELNRDDKVAKYPEWLTSAEFRINTALRMEEMVRHAELAVTERRFPYPPDFLEGKTLTIESEPDGTSIGRFVYVPADQLDAGLVPAMPPRGPRYYTVRGRFIELEPWNLSGTYTADLWYYAKLPKLLQDTDTNFLLTDAPHIYVRAVAYFGYLDLKEVENANRTLSEVVGEIELLNQTAERLKAGTGPLIARPPKRLGGRRS